MPEEHDTFYSTGRGGAGNIAHGSVSHEPTFAAEGSDVPEIRQDVYTTGRGGAGNMRPNTDPELTRIRQDVDVRPGTPKSPYLLPSRSREGRSRSRTPTRAFSPFRSSRSPAPAHSPARPAHSPAPAAHASAGSAVDNSIPHENPTFSETSVGRGGYGNVKATKEAAAAEKQSFVDRVKGIFKNEDGQGTTPNK